MCLERLGGLGGLLIAASAAVAVLGLATAIPAFADGEDQRCMESANSLPSGFYAHTPEQVQTQIKQNYFAAQQAKPVAKDANRASIVSIF